MGRGPLTWIVGIAVGVVLVLGVTALIGNRDDSGEPVTAGEWAQNVCGAVGVWRGEIEAIVEDIRTPSASSTAGEEPQSETPQGRTGFVREGLERGVQATETHGRGRRQRRHPRHRGWRGGGERVSDWADSALERARGVAGLARRRGGHARGRRSSSSPKRRERSRPCSPAAHRRSSRSLDSTPSSPLRSSTRARVSSCERRGVR